MAGAVRKQHEVSRRFEEIGIVGLVDAESPDAAVEVARAIVEGGIAMLEISLTVPGANDVIGELARSLKDALIGAGGVLDAHHATLAMEAGAEFVASPGFDPETVQIVSDCEVLMIPGALTPTEVIRAWHSGCGFVKIFPCDNIGGPGYMKSIKSAVPHVRMIAAGGVSLSNAEAFVRAGASAIGVGAELTSSQSITETARQFAAVVKGVRR